MKFNHKASPQKIIKFLDKCNSYVQWETICNDLDHDDVAKLLQDGHLIEESTSYIRIGSKLRQYHREFCEFTDKLQDILEFKTHITKLNISGAELQCFLKEITDRFKNEEFDLEYKEICRLNYYMSNLCSIIHSTRYFLKKHVLCPVCKIKPLKELPDKADFPKNIDFLICKKCVYYKDVEANEIKQLELKGFTGKVNEESIKTYVSLMDESDKAYFASIGVCTNTNPDKLNLKYSQFQNDYDTLNKPITNNYLYAVCSDIRNIIAHGGHIHCSVFRKEYPNKVYYLAMADYHKLNENSTSTSKKGLAKYYYNETLFFIDVILQGYLNYLTNDQIERANSCLQLALDNNNIDVKALSEQELAKIRNNDEIKLYRYNNSFKHSLMWGEHFFDLSSCFNDIYTGYIALYTQLYEWMRVCNQTLIADYHSVGNLLEAEFAKIGPGGAVNVPNFDLQLIDLEPIVVNQVP